MKLSHEVLLTLAYVSQISDPDSVRSRFIESLNGLDEGFSFEFVDRLPPGVPENRILPIATMRSSFGYAVMAKSPEPGEDELAVFRNAFKFLAALLENRMQAQALESKNESLLKEINIEKSLVRTVLDTLPVGVWVADKKGTILMGNAADEKIWAGTRYIGTDQYGGYNAWWPDTGKHIEPEDWGIARAIKAGETVIDQEIDIECFDGTRKNILHSAAPLLNDERRVIGAVGVNQNITERKLAEDALRESEEKFKHVFESANVGKSVTSLTGEIYVNKAFCDLLGYAPEELKNKTWQEFTPPDEIETIQNILNPLLKGEKDSARFNKRYLHKNGTFIWADVSVAVQLDSEGKPFCFITTIVDITARKQMESRLQQSQKMESIGTLAGGIAHDFNNILFPIVGLSEILLEDLPRDSPLYENAQAILKAGKRGSDLVRQILSFSRQAEHKLIPVRIQQILNEVLRLCRSTIPSNIEVTQDIQNDCGLVMADPTQLHQIAMNLITNAYHAVEEAGGAISVRLKETQLTSDDFAGKSLEPGKYAMLTVSDTGHGIDPLVMNRIFEPYFTTKVQGKGTGLGLSVVYGIIKEHGGDIQVYSEVGHGATFNVYLPLMDRTGGAKPSEMVAVNETGTERVLLVDDEEVIARMERQMLERLGYQVTSRTGSVEAMEVFKANPNLFDLVLTDMTMPNMTGIELSEELISIRPDIPIIICTGFSEKLSEDKAKDIGIKGFLMKPVVKSDMAQMVRKVLDEMKGQIQG